MASVVKNSAVVAQGISRLLFQFRDKPRMVALLTAWLNEFQAVENALYDIYYQRILSNGVASGDLLAKLGKLVGQGSEGLTDAQFRQLIAARIVANKSKGTRNDLFSVLELLLPNSGQIIFYEYASTVAPLTAFASFLIQADNVNLPPYLVGQKFLSVATAAGVWMVFIWSNTDDAHTLKLGSVVGPITTTANQSLGSTNGGYTSGGLLPGVVASPGGVK